MSEITAVNLLQESIDINTQRGETYNGSAASPERSFARIAEIVNTKAQLELEPSHIALVLAELKYVRFESALKTGQIHRDSLVDYVNYSAIWAELAAQEEQLEQQLDSLIEQQEDAVAYTSAEDEYLFRAADAMQFLASARTEINESVVSGSTEALSAYSRAIKALNEVSKPTQEALFGSVVTDLMNLEDTDATNSVPTEGD